MKKQINPIYITWADNCDYCGSRPRNQTLTPGCDEKDFYVLTCPECDRVGCPDCMPAGRGCMCPECEERE